MIAGIKARIRGMMIHVVMWKLNEDLNRQAVYSEVSEMFQGLMGAVPGLQSIELGLNENTSDAAWDLALRSTHTDRQALEAYRIHPEHQKVGARIGQLTRDRAVVDFSA